MSGTRRAKRAGLDADELRAWAAHWRGRKGRVLEALEAGQKMFGAQDLFVLWVRRAADVGRRFFRRQLRSQFFFDVQRGESCGLMPDGASPRAEERATFRAAADAMHLYVVLESVCNVLDDAGLQSASGAGDGETSCAPAMFSALRTFFLENEPAQAGMYQLAWDHAAAIKSMAGWVWTETRGYSDLQRNLDDGEDLLAALQSEMAVILLDHRRRAEAGEPVPRLDLGRLRSSATGNIRKRAEDPSHGQMQDMGHHALLLAEEEMKAKFRASELFRDAEALLTPNEYQVLVFMAKDLSAPEIAEEMGKAVGTIYSWQDRLKEKLKKAQAA